MGDPEFDKFALDDHYPNLKPSLRKKNRCFSENPLVSDVSRGERIFAMKWFAASITALFALQLVAGCATNPVSNLSLNSATSYQTLSSDLSSFQAIDYHEFRDLWDRTLGLEGKEDPARYHGKKYAITAIMEYEPATTLSAIRWNALLYEPTGKNFASAFYVLRKTFLSSKQADKFYQNLGGVRADDVISGAVDPFTGGRTVKKHAKAYPMTIYFVFDAHEDKEMEEALDIEAIRTPNGKIVRF